MDLNESDFIKRHTREKVEPADMNSQHDWSPKYVALCFGLALALTAGGCSRQPTADYSKLNLVAGGGTVTMDGQPLPNAVVMFEDVKDGTIAVGLTDVSGRYVLQIDSRKKGVTVGKKVVRISTATRIPGLNASFSSEGGSEEHSESVVENRPQELVPPRYNRQSELVVEVEPGKTRYDFDLSSR
ncbi:MAG: hypothetical protein KatS3mg112_0715 [Thermogutta sp.]|nr:MAG: hypothetical protein KatS3mg112_0715 [Thermogutta sp.]